MSRRMSCSLTVDAVRARTKTVTRRHVDTWRNLKPGDRLTLIEKGMGLPKGATQVVLADVEITDVRVEPLGAVDDREVMSEGFGDMHPSTFIGFWLRSHGMHPMDMTHRQMIETPIRRIEWRYLEDNETR